MNPNTMFIDILCVLHVCSHIVSDEWRSYANINRIHIAIYKNSVVPNVVVVVLLLWLWLCCRNIVVVVLLFAATIFSTTSLHVWLKITFNIDLHRKFFVL